MVKFTLFITLFIKAKATNEEKVGKLPLRASKRSQDSGRVGAAVDARRDSKILKIDQI